MVELLIVMGIITILFTIGTLSWSGIQGQSQIDSLTSQVISAIYKTRAQNLNNIKTYLYFDSTRYIIFYTSTFKENDPNNEVNTLPGGYSFVNINFPSQTLTFQNVTGYVSSYSPPASIAIKENQNNRQKTISVNRIGIVETQ